MKTLISFTGFCFIMVLAAGCNKWKEAKAIVVQNVNVDSVSLGANYKKYIENLRYYKTTKHVQMMGFMNSKNWLTDSTKRKTFLFSMPDSMDMVGVMNQDAALTQAQIADMQATQSTKGTRVIFTVDLRKMDNTLKSQRAGWPSPDTTAAINKYLDSAISVYNKYKYDGIYLIYEELSCFDCTGMFSVANKKNITTVIKKLGALAGPQSGTANKLLLQSRDAQYLESSVGRYLDYFVFDASETAVMSYYLFDGFVDVYKSIEGFAPSKFMLLISFDLNVWVTGGNMFPNNDGTLIPSTQAFATWNTMGGLKGGLCIQYVEEDYNNSPPYKFTRQSIQLLNPSVR